MIISYIIVINILGLLLCFIDKRKAIKHQYRISEKNLLLINILGGCFGFYLGMLFFRHKTNKIKFYILVPIILIIWFFIIYNLHLFF